MTDRGQTAAGQEMLLVERQGASDDRVKVVRWLVAVGARVRRGVPVVEVETSKATLEVDAHRDGFLSPLAHAGDSVPVGQPLAKITDHPSSPVRIADASIAQPSGATVSRRAQTLMDEHGLTVADFPGASAIRAQDVRARIVGSADDLAREPRRSARARRFAGEALDPDADWDALLAAPELVAMRAMSERLRRRLRARFDRHVPTGTLLHDRWALARELGFGEHSSIYDECLVLGDVRVGAHCWVGPFAVLDGAHAPLTIGDHSSIGSGAQVYTHDTIQRTLTGGQTEPRGEATEIGRCCFISPLAMIGPGTRLGDHSFVAAGSFVKGVFPAHSLIAGNPARRVGTVVIEDGRAILKQDASE